MYFSGVSEGGQMSKRQTSYLCGNIQAIIMEVGAHDVPKALTTRFRKHEGIKSRDAPIV